MARDSQGIIITMMAQNLPRCFSVLAMEAQAVIQGLYFARKCDLSPVEIKTDSQQVVLKVLSTNEDRSPAGDFIRPIRDSLAGFHPQVVMSYELYEPKSQWGDRLFGGNGLSSISPENMDVELSSLGMARSRMMSSLV